MWKKLLLLIMSAAFIGGYAAWQNKTSILLYLVTQADKETIAENRPVIWEQGPANAAQSPAERPPNIVFILVDDMGMNDLTLFGGGVADGRVPTPHIDALAHQGALFTQAYAGNATCAPSRAMLMTGRYPTRTGFEFTPTPPGMGRMVSMISDDLRQNEVLPRADFNRDPSELHYDDMVLPTSEITIAELLQDQGYHTVHIGKWHLGKNEESNPNTQGFDESLLMEDMLYLPSDHPDNVEARLEFDPIDQFLWARGQYETSYNRQGSFEPGGYLTDYWTEESLKVIEANRNRPFFLYLAHWGVHTPLQATRADYEAVGDITPHRLRVYAAMVRALDRSVGEITAKLEAEGLADNTIIVFTNDNGGAGYVGLPAINAPYRGWKLTLFEGGIRVPMFVKWPARIAPGTVIDTPVAHIDVMPTLADAGGAPLPEGVVIDGVNMLPAAMGTGDVSRPNDALFWQSGYYQVVRAGDWKLQIDGRQDKVWLFNLATDPTERVNLAESEPAKLAELQALLTAHHADRVPPLYPFTLENPVMIDKTLADTPEAGDEYAWWVN